MCIIAICEKRKLTTEEFDNCWDSNTDGFGCACWDGSVVKFGKGFMEKEEARTIYEALPLPHVAHFRISSAGGVRPELTHPFLVTEDSPITYVGETKGKVLFHNGTIADYKTLLTILMMFTGKLPEGPISDTRVFAMALAKAGNGLFAIYSSQRFVVVSPEGFEKYGEWEEEEGIFFSNSTYRSNPVVPSASMMDGYWYKGQYCRFGESSSKNCKQCSWYLSDMVCYLRGDLKDLYTCSQYTTEDVSFDDDDEEEEEKRAPRRRRIARKVIKRKVIKRKANH